jgi:hypothetical protein
MQESRGVKRKDMEESLEEPLRKMRRLNNPAIQQRKNELEARRVALRRGLRFQNPGIAARCRIILSDRQQASI